MGAEISPYERGLLRDLRIKRRESGWRTCAYSNCQERGIPQEVLFFYRRGLGYDSYCAECRKAINSAWKYNKRMGIVGEDWSVNFGRAPWCGDHNANSKSCGCATGRFHKTPAHRAKIAAAMRGNSNARKKDLESASGATTPAGERDSPISLARMNLTEES